MWTIVEIKPRLTCSCIAVSHTAYCCQSIKRLRLINLRTLGAVPILKTMYFLPGYTLNYFLIYFLMCSTQSTDVQYQKSRILVQISSRIFLCLDW